VRATALRAALLVAGLPLLLGAAPGPNPLVAAYPAALLRLDGNTLAWRDGTRTPYRSGRDLNTPRARLDHADPAAMLAQPYPACTPLSAPAYASDPGRARDPALFGRLYGDSPRQVQAGLVPVPWFGQTLPFSRRQGAAEALRAVAAELAGHPEWRRYLTPSAGTYLWRVVAGSGRRSAHSWGIAIDLNTHDSVYWQWDGKREFATGLRWRNQFPAALVHTFERHGFIWGGRWYHYDTMHFEYRPELAHCPPVTAAPASR
jgi:D-alanyl-D-alanine carboxypeptidase